MKAFRGRNKRDTNCRGALHENEEAVKKEENVKGEEGKCDAVGKFKTYFLWLTFGFSGAHHFLLGRDIHAFLWLTTFGGFGIGVFRDLWRLKEYLNDANEEANYMKQLRATAEKYNRYWSVSTFLGQACISGAYFLIFQNFPSETDNAMAEPFLVKFFGWDLYYVCGMIGQALGIYLAGSTGRIRSNFKLVLLAVFLGSAIEGKKKVSTLGFVFGVITFRNFSSWNWDSRRLHREGKIWRLLKLIFFAVIFWVATIRGTYHHGSLPVSDSGAGESSYMKISELVEKVLESGVFVALKDKFHAIWPILLSNWWQPQNWWLMVLKSETGEVQAYNDLDMKGCVLEKEGCDYGKVKRSYYKLSRQYHPDKIGTDPTRKLEVEDKMTKINNAYEVLTKLHKMEKNRAD